MDFSIYEVPVDLVHKGLDRPVVEQMAHCEPVTDLVDWLATLAHPRREP